MNEMQIWEGVNEELSLPKCPVSSSVSGAVEEGVVGTGTGKVGVLGSKQGVENLGPIWEMPGHRAWTQASGQTLCWALPLPACSCLCPSLLPGHVSASPTPPDPVTHVSRVAAQNGAGGLGTLVVRSSGAPSHLRTEGSSKLAI